MFLHNRINLNQSKNMKCGVTGKVMFKTAAGAINRGNEILDSDINRRFTPNRFRSYKCEFCNSYHLTGKLYDTTQNKIVSH